MGLHRSRDLWRWSERPPYLDTVRALIFCGKSSQPRQMVGRRPRNPHSVGEQWSGSPHKWNLTHSWSEEASLQGLLTEEWAEGSELTQSWSWVEGLSCGS